MQRDSSHPFFLVLLHCNVAQGPRTAGKSDARCRLKSIAKNSLNNNCSPVVFLRHFRGSSTRNQGRLGKKVGGGSRPS